MIAALGQPIQVKNRWLRVLRLRAPSETKSREGIDLLDEYDPFLLMYRVMNDQRRHASNPNLSLHASISVAGFAEFQGVGTKTINDSFRRCQELFFKPEFTCPPVECSKRIVDSLGGAEPVGRLAFRHAHGPLRCSACSMSWTSGTSRSGSASARGSWCSSVTGSRMNACTAH